MSTALFCKFLLKSFKLLLVKRIEEEQKEYDTIDEDIANLEAKLEDLDAEMMKNATNSAKLSELTAEKEKVEQQLEEKMDRWVYLNDLAEQIAAQN